MRELLSILKGPIEMGRLDLATLELATVEYPDLDIGRWLGVLDAHAAELARRLRPEAGANEFIDAANAYLFGELGLTGDQVHYYDPANSCLNRVLESRTGIPITLSVVYMEIARRLGRPVYGIGLPGHFIVEYDDGETSRYIDPYNGGVRLGVEECFTLARNATGAPVAEDLRMLAPVTHCQMLLRMISNLRGVYFRRQNFGRAIRLLDVLLTAYPKSADEYKVRGMLHCRLHRLAAAHADLNRYLELAPAAPDREEVETRLHSVRQMLAGLN